MYYVKLENLFLKLVPGRHANRRIWVDNEGEATKFELSVAQLLAINYRQSEIVEAK